jgi:chromosome segregation ATPase
MGSERQTQAARADTERKALKDLKAELRDYGKVGAKPEQVRPLQQVRTEMLAARAVVDAQTDAVKDETLPDQLQRQNARVEELSELVEGSVGRVDILHMQVVDARRRFNLGVQQTIPRLDAQYRRLCEQTGMDGRMKLTERVTDEFGLDVRVRPTNGNQVLELHSSRLSGGQQAKAALIVQLACMSLEGSTDFLLSDEPGAHLDARNLREVGLAMQQLADRVQIIISVPTDAEAEKLDWADHQIGFRAPDPRDPDHPFSSLVVMSRTPPVDESRAERSFDED